VPKATTRQSSDKRTPYSGQEPARRDKETSVRRDFARRLRTLRVKKGWNQSETARQAAKHMPDGKFGRDNVSKYESESTLPTPVYAVALARALGVTVEDLIPTANPLAMDMEIEPALAFRQTGAKRAFLRINQEVDMSVALLVMELLGKQYVDEL
jgi:transcriptional regulator with XRE-family HTH domain